MVVAAIVAVGLGLAAWAEKRRRLSASYRSRAEDYQRIKHYRIGMATMFTGERDARHDRWAYGLVRKYERAARYPWLVIAPDPSEPK
jgi:hypothetical protein